MTLTHEVSRIDRKAERQHPEVCVHVCMGGPSF